MSLQSTLPENKNFLNPIGFKFSVQKLPHVNYFCTNASIPDMTLGQVDTITNTFIKLPTPGDKLTFGGLQIRFRVDEDLKNFKEIYDWMIALGYPDNFDQRAAISRNASNIGEVFSDGSLILTTSSYKPNIEIKFIDMYPVTLSTVDFDISQSDVEYVNADVSFIYRKYELTTIS